ncbi:MFS transporter [Actinoplanes sp. NPDC051470]|uniref:MFS transporter n=1 Tax=unclassified Actinoplanes TaxID=2626549 RepID=UPI00343B83A8
MRAWTIVAALTASTFLFVTTETLPIGLLPQIAGELGTPASRIGLLVTVYGLIVVVSTIPLTRLTHRWPRRRLLSTLLLISAAAMTLSALAPTYPVLVAGRIVTALSQAVFWAVVTPAAAALFPPAVRARAIAVLVAGTSAAPLLGVPGGTWLGQRLDWRAPFLVLAVLAVAASAVILALMPEQPPGGDAGRGRNPDARRYFSLIVTTTVTVTAAFTAFTCITPFLTDVTGLPGSAVGPVLLLRGLAGLLGAIAVGFLISRYAWPAMTGLIGLQAVALAAQYVWSGNPAATVIATAATGLVLSGLTVVLSARVLDLAPGDTDLASAGSSTAFNVGITAGALIGSGLLDGPGLRDSALIAALISVAAVISALAEPRRRGERSGEAGAFQGGSAHRRDAVLGRHRGQGALQQ